MKSKQYAALEALMRKAKLFKARTLDLDAELERKRKINSHPYKLPTAVALALHPTKLVIAKTTCYKVGQGKRIVMYLHGGSYVDPPLIFHWRFVQQLSREADVTVYLPLYGRAPQHHCSRTVPHMSKLFCELAALHGADNITVMGDSAGGGLSLALCENLVQTNRPLPHNVILLSPWLNVDMTGDYAESERRDPVLLTDELRFFGRVYRKQLPIGHYMASPLFGLTDKLPPVYVFAGESEIFLPDCVKLKQLADQAGADVTLYTYPDMPHVFVMYPIPEAKQARQTVVSILNAPPQTASGAKQGE